MVEVAFGPFMLNHFIIGCFSFHYRIFSGQVASFNPVMGLKREEAGHFDLR